MTVVKHKPKDSAQKLVPPLILGTLGTVGVVTLYSLVPSFQTIDLVLLLIVVCFGAVGYTQGIVRGTMTIIILYVATGVAATFYRMAAPFVGAIQQVAALDLNADSVNMGHGTLALSFSLLTVITWVVLEAIGRLSFRDTSLPGLGTLDNLGSMLIHVVIGILVTSLLFNAIGYGRSRRVHDEALLRPRFNQVLYLHYTAQSFWFPSKPPPIYVYDLNLPR